MSKKLPIIRIHTNRKENLKKIEPLFKSMVNRMFDFEIVLDRTRPSNGDFYADVDVFYSYDLPFIQSKIDEIAHDASVNLNPVLFISIAFPDNLSLLSAKNNLVSDFIKLPAGIDYLQFKIDQLLSYSYKDTFRNTDKLLSIQHKIEFHNWFHNDLESSLKYLLNSLSEIEWIDGGGIYFFTKDKDSLVLVSHFGLSDDFIQKNKTFPPESPQVSVVQNKQPFFGRFVNLQKRLDQVSNPEGIMAIAILPVIHNGEAIGCINLASKTKEVIPENDQVALEIIASRIGSIISFLKAFDDLKQAKFQLEMKVNKGALELEKAAQVLQLEIKTHEETRDALLYSENIYQNIFNYANDGIVLYDIETLRPVDINPKAYLDLGYTKEEFLKLNFDDYTIYKSKDERNQLFKRLFKETHIEYDVKHLTRSKEIRYRTISANIITINNKVYILGIVHDITDLKKKEIELRKIKDELSQLQSNIPIGMFMTGIDGKILYANKYLAGLLGYDSELELQHVSVLDFYQDKALRDLIIETLKKAGKIDSFEIKIMKKDLTVFWGSLSIKSVHDEAGNPVRLDGIVVDITEKKMARLDLENAHQEILKTNLSLQKKINEALKEQQNQHQYIIQKSKLESLGELAAGIAHEINQPLGIMTLAFENLQSRLQKGTGNEDYIDKKISSIVSNIDRIRDIINHIRIFSREQDSMDMQKVNVNKVIQDVLKLIKTQYQNHNITLTLDLHEKPGFTIGSKLKMEQVLLNLLSNAKYAVEENEFNTNSIDYSKTILIKTDVVENRIHLMIEDNGIGIQPDKLNSIFDPFYTTKPEWVGTGLGLSITYGIIKDMRGTIKVESKPKKFTRFDILLPRFPEKD